VGDEQNGVAVAQPHAVEVEIHLLGGECVEGAERRARQQEAEICTGARQMATRWRMPPGAPAGA
jgi:hypothetical protein